MTPQERDVLVPLLTRLRQTQLPSKDAEADQLIRQTMQAQPDAPYILTQTVLMQDYALHAAQERIQALEQQLAQARQQAPQQQGAGGGGFLSGLLHGGRPQAQQPAPLPPGGYGQGYPQQAGYPQGGVVYGPPSYGVGVASAMMPGGGGGSFLRGAAQTAAGVAGGMLLAQGLENLFDGGRREGIGSGFMGDALGGGGAQGVADVPGGPGSVDQFVDQGGGAYDAGTAAGDQNAFLDSGGDQGYADAGGDAGYADDAGGGLDDGGGFDDGGLGDDSFNS